MNSMTQFEQPKAKALERIEKAISSKAKHNIPFILDTLIKTVYQAAHSEGVRVADADGAYHSGFLAGNQARTEEVKERCAVEVWNVLAQFTDCMEPTDRTNALSEAIKRIRGLDFATLKDTKLTNSEVSTHSEEEVN